MCLTNCHLLLLFGGCSQKGTERTGWFYFSMASCRRAIPLRLGLCFPYPYAMLLSSFNDMLAFMDTLTSTAENSRMLVTYCCAGEEDTGGTRLLTIDMHLRSCSSLWGRLGWFSVVRQSRRESLKLGQGSQFDTGQLSDLERFFSLSLGCLNESLTCYRRDQAILGSCRWKLLWMVL